MVSGNWDTWLTSWVCGVFAVVLVVVLVALLLKTSRGTPIQEWRVKTAQLSCSSTCKKWHDLTDLPPDDRNNKVPGGGQREEVKISAPVTGTFKVTSGGLLVPSASSTSSAFGYHVPYSLRRISSPGPQGFAAVQNYSSRVSKGNLVGNSRQSYAGLLTSDGRGGGQPIMPLTPGVARLCSSLLDVPEGVRLHKHSLVGTQSAQSSSHLVQDVRSTGYTTMTATEARAKRVRMLRRR